MRASTIALIVLLTSSVVQAQDDARPAQGAVRGTIRGRVVAAADGTPLRRVRIVLESGGRRTDPVLTDDEGRFAVAPPERGPVVLEASKAGYALAVARIPERDAQRRLQIRLLQGASIAGSVMDEARTPIPVAEVSARRVNSSSADTRDSSSPPFAVRTDTDGTYRLGGLPPGEYTVTVTRWLIGRTADVPSPVVTVSLQSGDALENVNLQFGELGIVGESQAALARLRADGRTIAGIVADEHGEPMQGVTVEARQLEYLGRQVVTRVTRGERTDDRGRYALRQLNPGTYVVAVSDDATLWSESESRLAYVPVYHPGTTQVTRATRLRLDQFADINGIDVTLSPTFNARVAGVALDARGRPLRGTITLGISGRSGFLATDMIAVNTSPDGTFLFPNVPSGDYVLKARGWPDLGRTGDFGVEYVSIGERDPPPLTIRAAPQAMLEGVIVVNDAPQSTANTVTLAAVPFDIDRAPTKGQPSGTLAISSTGEFYMTGLQGPMRLALATQSESWYIKSITIGAVDATTAGFDFGVTGETFADARIELARATGAIEGRVTVGAAPSAGGVVVFSTNRDDWFTASPYLKFARVAPDGSFRVEGVPPGDYAVAAVSGIDGTADGGEWQNPEVLDALAQGAQRVSISEGQRVAIGALAR